MRLVSFLLLACCGVVSSFGQDAQPAPFSSQLKTDPGVGNVQGIQRLGRPLRTDPDQGDGYSFHVFPVTQSAANPYGSSLSNRPAPVIVAPATYKSAGGPAGSKQPIVKGPTQDSSGQQNQQANQRLKNAAPEESGGDPLLNAPDPPKELGGDPLFGHIKDPPPLTKTPEDKNRKAIEKGDKMQAINSRPVETSPRTQPAVYAPAAGSGYGAFDWTSGLRNMGPPAIASPIMSAETETQSATITRQGTFTDTQQIYHQPLIQIKMRVVEVNRGDALTVGSILEYVSRDGGDSSLTTGQTANAGSENFRNISRFVGSNLTTNATSGTGALINLTSEHINSLVQGLSTELNADVITAPEVVTLNGQNVEFVSGNKLPFQLGQNVIQGTNNNIQQVFYKHVGTMVSVTPRIVNWGFHGEGQGERSIQASEILNWKKLIDGMMNAERDGEFQFSVAAQGSDINDLDGKRINKRVVGLFSDNGIALKSYSVVANLPGSEWRIRNGNDFFFLINRSGRIDVYRERRFVRPDGRAITPLLQTYKDQAFIPFSAQTEILFAINNFSRGDIQRIVTLIDSDAISPSCGERCKNWRPKDCTIDLAVVVRLSEAGRLRTANDPDDATLSGSENNVRAVANVIQLRSGHGVVMAGLIGERESSSESKFPVLGDLPLIGTLFRSKAVAREKTEVLVFIEANVLDPKPTIARAEAAADYRLGQAYVDRGVLDNPLELGMHRVGFGSYLPPGSQNEQLYWEKYQRAIRRASTHVSDTLNP